jgi:6-phosphofructokinase 1
VLVKRIAVLTGGGDAPGLNAVIRAVVKTAVNVFGCEVLGVVDGYDGFIAEGGVTPLALGAVRGILPLGGTILGTANRGNPFARKVVKDGKETVIDVSDEIAAAIHRLKLDGVIVIGGDGTLRIAAELHDKGVPVVGVPKTIDNDVGGTEVTFGFDTALSIATEALDRLHTTAEAHHRVMVLELMGRDAGFIALHAGVSGGADVILIPEIPFRFESIVKKVRQRAERGSRFSLLAVSEGAKPVGGQEVYSRPGDAIYTARLGGIGQEVGRYVESQGFETRVTVLGHLQRGGTPCAFDRELATRYGVTAVELIQQGKFGQVVALDKGKMVAKPMEKAIKKLKLVDPNGELVRTARSVGIEFGG